MAASCLVGASPTATIAQAACTGTQVLFSQSAAAGTRTGTLEEFVVPADVSSMTITAAGAQGGMGERPGGLGAEIQSVFTVAPKDLICMLVGVEGEACVGGGGGGGGTFVWTTTDPSCAVGQATDTTLLVAAGAGGGGTFLTSAGPGLPGLATGLGAGPAGALPGGASTDGAAGGTGGNGGATGFAGGGGGLISDGASNLCQGGLALTNGATGGAGCNMAFWGDGAFGGGGSTGGGGGYNGGGGIGAPDQRNGGGGSFSAVTPLSAQDGVQSGNGVVELCYSVAAPPAIPTLTEWAMMILILALGGCGANLVLRRRRVGLSA